MHKNLSETFDSVTAPNGARFNAFTVDLIFASAISQFICSVIGSNHSFLLNLIISCLYYAAPLVLTGQTLGKKIFGLRVVPVGENRKINIKEALLRETIGKWISLGTFFGVLLVFFREDHRALHDLVGKTLVVQDASVAEKRKNFWFNFARSSFVAILITVVSTAYTAYSSLFADMIESRLTAQGIKVQKVTGNLATGFHFQNLEFKVGEQNYKVNSADIQIGEYLKIFTEQTFTITNFKISDSELKLAAGDANSLVYGLLTVPYFLSSSEDLFTPKNQITFTKTVVSNFAITNSKIIDSTTTVEIKNFTIDDLAFDLKAKTLSWNELIISSSVFDLTTKQIKIGNGSIDLPKPLSAKIYSIPKLKIKQPIDLIATFDFKEHTLKKLQVNAVSNKVTIVGSDQNPFQLWVNSLEAIKYADDIPFDSLSFYSTNKSILSLIALPPETASIRLGSGEFLLTDKNSSEAIFRTNVDEMHLVFPQGFLSSMLFSQAKPELFNLKGAQPEQLLKDLGSNSLPDIANRFTSPQRLPATF